MAAKRKNRFWSDDEKRSICEQARAEEISVAQVARRYAMNPNLIHKWLRDPKFAPNPEIVEDEVSGTLCFLPVGVVDRPQVKDTAPRPDSKAAQSALETDIAGGHRLRIIGCYAPEALACLNRSNLRLVTPSSPVR